MITGVVRASYVVLKEAKENLSGQMKFSISLLVPKTDKKTIAALEADVAKAIQKGKETKWGGKKPKFRYDPIRDGDAEIASGDKEKGKGYEGCVFVNCSSDDPPGIAGPDGKGTMDRDIIYSGCYVRADINAFPYANKGNSGVGWGLNNVMFVEDGDRLDGRQDAETAFADFAEEGPEEEGELL